MGCSPSSSNRIWRNSGHNSVLPVHSYPTPVRREWTDTHFYGSYNSPLPPLQPAGEPPPYTEHPEDGHVSLMYGPSKVDDTPSAMPVHNLLDESTGSQLSSIAVLETEQEQDSRAGTSSVDILSQSLDMFRPTRTSSPLPASALFPERPQRSRSIGSVSNSSPRQLFPPRPALESMHTPTRRVILPTIMSTTAPSNAFPAHPSRLPPLQHQVSYPPEQNEEHTDRPHPLIQYQPSLPVGQNEEYLDRPLLQDQPSYQSPHQTGEHVQTQHWLPFDADQNEDFLPLRNQHNWQNRRSDGRHGGRKRRKRKRVHTWHGERVAQAAQDQQDAMCASTINECIT